MTQHPETLAVTAGRVLAAGQPLNPAIAPSSTYRAGGEWTYGRDGNSGWRSFEEAIGALESGTAVAFSTGIAAAAAVLSTVPVGGVVVAPSIAYHGVVGLMHQLQQRGQVTLRTVDFTSVDQVRDAASGAAMVWVESPTNPMIDVVDLPFVVKCGRDVGAAIVVDSTLATPLLQQPLNLDVDYVLHSATKYIGGHSDLLLGLVACSDSESVDALRAYRHDVGSTPGALEVFLALRGLRTLPVRLARSQQTAQVLSERLEAHPAVSWVSYPGLASHPHHDLARRQMSGFGAMVAFETVGDWTQAEAFAAGLELIVHGTSLGGVETLIERRARYEGDAAQGVPPTLLRMSVGLEHVEDLWSDLESGLSRLLREQQG
ncbi:MAG TPA: PLP-dependent transferase [Actinomycetes bacterium]|nr:PLP-dependent transferase [Actinomycetes bacterium]